MFCSHLCTEAVVNPSNLASVQEQGIIPGRAPTLWSKSISSQLPFMRQSIFRASRDLFLLFDIVDKALGEPHDLLIDLLKPIYATVVGVFDDLAATNSVM